VGGHQGEHSESCYYDLVWNAAANSLAFHGSPVSRLAGTAARFGLIANSITREWQYKDNSICPKMDTRTRSGLFLTAAGDGRRGTSWPMQKW